MKPSKILAALLAVTTLWFIVGCAGAPPAPEPEPVLVEPAPEPAPQPVVEPVSAPVVIDETISDALRAEVDSAAAAAAAARKQAFDVGVPTFFPPDWKAAEDLFLKARNDALAKTKTAMIAARDGYKAAAAAYLAAAGKALPLFAENRQAEIVAARKSALDRHVDTLDPARLAVADAGVDAALVLYRNGDYYGADAVAVEARNRYYALSVGADAYAVQQEIDRRNLAKYDAGNYQLAANALTAAMTAYDTGTVAASRNSGDEAFLRFKLALAKGRELYSVDRGKAAEQEQIAAREIKAQVAVKADYDVAAALRAQADQLFAAADFDTAATLYQQAEGGFAQARAAAAVKRAAAEVALREAEASQEATRRNAAEADAAIEGGAQ